MKYNMGGKRSVDFWIMNVVAVLGVIWVIALLLAIKPANALWIKESFPTISSSANRVTFAWPEDGYAAIGMDGYVKANYNGEAVVPTASIAKLVTALMILDAKPLRLGEVGELITITAQDVALYEHAKSTGQSNLSISEGQTITEYQALQGMMMVSSNNLAYTLAAWVFGSQDEYVTAANNWLVQNGLTNTKVNDASGFSPNTVSTANELVRLAMIANNNDVLREIFSTKTAQFPGVGEIKNTNLLLGIDGIYGLKTGYTPETGTNLLFMSEIKVNGVTKNIAGVVLGQREGQLNDAVRALNASARDGIGEIVIFPQDTLVGTINSGWGDQADVVLSSPLSMVGWKDDLANGREISIIIDDGISPGGTAAGSIVGKIKSGNAEVSLITKGAISEPGLMWRVTHPF